MKAKISNILKSNEPFFEDRVRRARKVLPDGPDWQCYLANDYKKGST